MLLPGLLLLACFFSTKEATTTFYGNTVTGQDPSGKKRKTVTDALGRLSQVIEDPTGVNLTTTYKYDILGNMRVVEQGDQRRYYMYDSLSRLIRSRNPEQDANTNYNLSDPISNNSQWANKFEYASNGNMLAKFDSRGVKIEYSYDNLNRLYKRHYVATQTPPTGTYTATPDDEYFYDGKGLSSTPDNALGKLTKTYSTVSQTRYTQFDSMGRLLSSEQITEGLETCPGTSAPCKSTYKYNLSGALISQTYPSGREVNNFFDDAGDVSAVSGRVPTKSYRTYISNIDYDFTSTGATSQVQLGNGRWESTEFNKRLQPTQIALGTTQGATNLLKLNYSYGSTNNNGNMVSQTITVPTVGENDGFTAVQNYTYDGLNRLLNATETSNSTTTWQQTFTYDRFGNRQVNTNQSATTESLIGDNPEVSDEDNRITSRMGEQYLYDATGNLIRDKIGNLFAYNGENQQTTYTPLNSSQPTAYYIYDSDGRRVKKISGNETTIFVYNGLGQMVAEYAINVPVPQNPTTSYLTADNLGTPRINTDSTGDVQARHDYLPFGEEIGELGGRNANNGYTADNIRHKFTGYQRDNESGLDFAQARYYASTAGRFTSVDPLMASAKTINPQTFNRYTYVLNNPYRYVDPSGMESDEVDRAFAYLGELVDLADAEREAAREAALLAMVSQAAPERMVQQTGPQNSQQGQAPVDPTRPPLLPSGYSPPINCPGDGPECNGTTPQIPEPFASPLKPAGSPNGEAVPTSAITNLYDNFGLSGPSGTIIDANADIVIRDQNGSRIFGDFYKLTETVIAVRETSVVPQGFWALKFKTSDGEPVGDVYTKTVKVTNGGNAVDKFTLDTSLRFAPEHRLVVKQILVVTDTRNQKAYTVAHNIIVFSTRGVNLINCNNGCR